MVKLARSPYRTAKRSPEWVKYKLNKQDEFVVCGWTDPGGARAHFGSLILGAHDANGLRYAGEVGTGFKGAELERIMKMLRKLETPTCPLNPKPKILSAKGSPHWVRPQLVAQVRYTEITDDGRLRHPAYLGLRDDKSAAEVTVPKVPEVPKGSKGSVLKAVPKVPKISDRDIDAIVDQLNALEKARKNGRLTLPGGDFLEVTNLHKIFWPAVKKTKGDLIRYYAKISPFILPVIDNRPLVMKRLPNGVDGPSFYQHRAPDAPPPGVRFESLPNDDVPARLIGGSLKTLLYMAQLASISMDPWFSTMDDLDSADQVAIDLDPQPGATFSQILDCAEWVEEELDRVKVQGFPKTSGSEGLHVFIPLPPGTPYEAGMLFCQIIATLIAAKHPKVATVERMVRRRKDGTIYVDYLQNIQGKTLACAYSARGQRVRGCVDAADLEGSASAPEAAGLHDRHHSPAAEEGRRPVGEDAQAQGHGSACRDREAAQMSQGSGIRDQGSGIRDQGSGIRDRGQRTFRGVSTLINVSRPRCRCRESLAVRSRLIMAESSSRIPRVHHPGPCRSQVLPGPVGVAEVARLGKGCRNDLQRDYPRSSDTALHLNCAGLRRSIPFNIGEGWAQPHKGVHSSLGDRAWIRSRATDRCSRHAANLSCVVAIGNCKVRN